MTAVATDVVLRIDGLVVEFDGPTGPVQAVRGVDLDVVRGRTVALVGESGCGKSATLLGSLGLLGRSGRVVAGRTWLHGEDLADRRRLVRARGREIGMVFQDPLTSLHPAMTVGDQLVEAIRVHTRGTSRAAATVRAAELLDRVGISRPRERLDEHPHQWSGGMRQRAMIAMAIAHDPAVLIADEPTTALDVTVQAQILDLLADLRAATGMALVLVTHDLGVVAEFADEVAVMYHGRIVEQAPVDDLFARPRHPYTRGLLDNVPAIDGPTVRASLRGSALPSTTTIPGCAFEPRCRVGRGDPLCCTDRPVLEGPGAHRWACHHPLEAGP